VAGDSFVLLCACVPRELGGHTLLSLCDIPWLRFYQ